MKYLLSVMLFCIIYCPLASAQTLTEQRSERSIPLNFIEGDSIRISLNEDFDMIEDSCAQIFRYGHLNVELHKFTGKFRDISTLDTNRVITEGNYSASGQKDGMFISRYLNGNLQAKGSFKNDHYDGKWQAYYEDGKPKLFFEADNGDIKIVEAWNEKGIKIVNDGYGAYTALVGNGTICWKGTLINGRPDGTWSCMNTDDATQTEISFEKFKNGVFIKGRSPLRDYTIASRILLVSNTMLSFTNAEYFHLSAAPCSSTNKKHVIVAQYPPGISFYTGEVTRLISAYFKNIDVSHFSDQFTIDGIVNEKGMLSNLNSENSFEPNITSGLVLYLKRLPPLNPATIDGKPTRQRIHFTFNFGAGMYHFSYNFGEVLEK